MVMMQRRNTGGLAPVAPTMPAGVTPVTTPTQSSGPTLTVNPAAAQAAFQPAAPGSQMTTVQAPTAHQPAIGAPSLLTNPNAPSNPGGGGLDFVGDGAVAGTVGAPNPALYNTMGNPWATSSYQGYQQQANNVGAVMNADGSNAIPGAQASLTSADLLNSRAGQTSLANTLATQAAGGGMSAADIQQQQGISNSILASQAAAATAGNSTNPFLLQRQLMSQQAATNQAGVGQAALLRAQETQAAQQALGSVYNAQGQSALAQNTAAAQLAQSNSQFAQTGMQTAANNYATGQMNLANAQQGAGTTNAGLATNVSLANAGADAAFGGKVIGAAGSAAAAALPLALASDERVKESVDRGSTDGQLDDFMSSLDHASYDYTRPEQHGRGRHFGIMAQSAERSEAGRTMVSEDASGTKVLDIRKGLGLALAGLSRLAKRQDDRDALLKAASGRARG